MTLAEQIRSHSVRELAELAGVGHQTAAHAHQDGRVRNGPAGRKILAYLAERFGPPDGNGATSPLADAGARMDLREKKAAASYVKTREEARRLKRENDVTEGQLMPVEDFNGRITAAANELRSSAETLRRDVLATVPTRARHRKAVREALDAGLDRLRERVAGALGG